MAKWQEWSKGWIKEGDNISYMRGGVEYFEYVLAKDFAHWDYPWHETIAAGAESGPETPGQFEITKGWSKDHGTNRIWQFIIGIKGQIYLYIELPGDTHRHGIPKEQKPRAAFRTVSHFQEFMSPYHEPSFITEHFLMRPIAHQVTLEVFNPNSIAMPAVRLNFMINKLMTRRIGHVIGGIGGQIVPFKEVYRELLDQLVKHQKPCRPITIEPVRAPGAAPHGE